MGPPQAPQAPQASPGCKVSAPERPLLRRMQAPQHPPLLAIALPNNAVGLYTDSVGVPLRRRRAGRMHAAPGCTRREQRRVAGSPPTPTASALRRAGLWTRRTRAPSGTSAPQRPRGWPGTPRCPCWRWPGRTVRPRLRQSHQHSHQHSRQHRPAEGAAPLAARPRPRRPRHPSALAEPPCLPRRRRAVVLPRRRRRQAAGGGQQGAPQLRDQPGLGAGRPAAGVCR
jgi:hypothetical protein